MTVVKQVAQSVMYPVATAAVVGLSLWVLLGLLHIGKPDSYQMPEPPPAITPKPALAPVSPPEGRSIAAGRSGVPGDNSPYVEQMQGALIKKGYSVGPAGADSHFNDDTLAALEAFQDHKALPVRPTCDQRCWTALGLPDSK
jgi:hypothetical protein